MAAGYRSAGDRSRPEPLHQRLPPEPLDHLVEARGARDPRRQLGRIELETIAVAPQERRADRFRPTEALRAASTPGAGSSAMPRPR